MKSTIRRSPAGERRFGKFLACVLSISFAYGTLLLGEPVSCAAEELRNASTVATEAVNPDPTKVTYVLRMPRQGSEGFQLREPVTSQLNGFGITINPGPGLQGNAAALAAFQRAAQAWQARIADPISINIDANLAPLGPGVLAQASSVSLLADYDVIRDQMVVDAADESDDTVTAFLPTSALAQFEVPVGFGLSGNVFATKANLKALGFTGLDTQFGATDATITFSSTFNFDYDNSNGVVGFDFESVAAHEIGHALGFVSEVDRVDAAVDAGTPLADVAPSTLDLFRFNRSGVDDPSNFAEFTTFARSLVPGSDDSLDQINNIYGGDVETRLSTGSTAGDGQQASHWKDNQNPILGVMGPTLPPGVIVTIGPNDLRALDLIGYEITQVPEPTALFLLALGLCGMQRRRRR